MNSDKDIMSGKLGDASSFTKRSRGLGICCYGEPLLNVTLLVFLISDYVSSFTAIT